MSTINDEVSAGATTGSFTVATFVPPRQPNATAQSPLAVLLVAAAVAAAVPRHVTSARTRLPFASPRLPALNVAPPTSPSLPPLSRAPPTLPTHASASHCPARPVPRPSCAVLATHHSYAAPIRPAHPARHLRAPAFNAHPPLLPCDRVCACLREATVPINLTPATARATSPRLPVRARARPHLKPPPRTSPTRTCPFLNVRPPCLPPALRTSHRPTPMHLRTTLSPRRPRFMYTRGPGSTPALSPHPPLAARLTHPHRTLPLRTRHGTSVPPLLPPSASPPCSALPHAPLHRSLPHGSASRRFARLYTAATLLSPSHTRAPLRAVTPHPVPSPPCYTDSPCPPPLCPATRVFPRDHATAPAAVLARPLCPASASPILLDVNTQGIIFIVNCSDQERVAEAREELQRLLNEDELSLGYLMDFPKFIVCQFQDSHTAHLLFDKLLRGPLLAHRTVILVTHHVDLVLSGAHYLKTSVLKASSMISLTDTATDAKAEEPVAAIGDSSADLDDAEAKPKKPRKLVKDEHRANGGVKWAIYRSYLQASSYGIWAFLLFAVLLGQLLSVGEKLWIKTWGNAYQQNTTLMFHSYQAFRSLNPEYPMDGSFNFVQVNSRFEMAPGVFGINWPSAIDHPLFYVGVHAAIGLTTAFFSLCSVAAQYTRALRASRKLFRQLLVSVVRATFRFHDTTPLGRMLNRFGLDMDKIDSDLAGSLQTVNSSIVFPGFLFPAFVLGYIYYLLALGYLNTGRDLRRMESNSRSPIVSDFGELLEGIVAVRGALAVFITALFSITFLDNDAGLAGLAITSALTFTNAVYWACRNWTGLEVDLNSVERVVEYLKLPQEPPAVIESNRPPAYWPSSARNENLLSVENLVVKYSPELPPVLQGISFTLKAGGQVGLIGRTGSGKSTLAMSILRFVDPVSGKIVLDGIDIRTIGINGDHDDAACMDALYRVHMISDNPTHSQGPSRGQSTAASPSSSRPPSISGSTTDVSLLTDVDTKASVSLDTQVSAGGDQFLARAAPAHSDGPSITSTELCSGDGRGYEQRGIFDGRQNSEGVTRGLGTTDAHFLSAGPNSARSLLDTLHDATRLNATPNNLPRSIEAYFRLKRGARRTHLGAAAIFIVDLCLIRSGTTLTSRWTVGSGAASEPSIDLFERAAFKNIPTVRTIRANAYSHGLRIGDTE
ncbi:hypothetical protein B0H14DRAFT_3880074 [Mycena olivaceomarginata]|nr:hypothetical protein B0H14DRAFT_3880074 [Mycena olivaceomarginata]